MWQFARLVGVPFRRCLREWYRDISLADHHHPRLSLNSFEGTARPRFLCPVSCGPMVACFFVFFGGHPCWTPSFNRARCRQPSLLEQHAHSQYVQGASTGPGGVIGVFVSRSLRSSGCNVFFVAKMLRDGVARGFQTAAWFFVVRCSASISIACHRDVCLTTITQG